MKILPEMYNTVVKMHFFEGLSYPQISKLIDIPVNTIKSYIFRAKQIMRQGLLVYAREWGFQGGYPSTVPSI
jgi:DNA-directed RNA polymerase specialized sigma24 family protein